MKAEREALEKILSRHWRDPHSLVQILRETQDLIGWLPRDLLGELARELKLPLVQVEGVVGVYRFFHTRPVGRYRVLFSDNITDRMQGSAALMTDLCGRLGIEPGQLSPDGLVSVDRTSCTGLCDQDPALLMGSAHETEKIVR